MMRLERPPLRVSMATACLLAFASRGAAQIKSPAERIQELEDRVDSLEKKLRDVEKAGAKAPGGKDGKADSKDEREDEFLFSGGVLTIGGVKLRLGGKAEFLFIDSASEDDPVVGETDEPDPHFEVDRLRLEPRLDFNREISIHSQIDFIPDRGDTFLKELTVRHNTSPEWWFASDARLGLDDRFIRPARRTKSYPLIGNAFWRDESVAFQWVLSFGDKDGPPVEETAIIEAADPGPTGDAGAPSEAAPKEKAGEDGATSKKAKGKSKKKKKSEPAPADSGGGGADPDDDTQVGTDAGPGSGPLIPSAGRDRSPFDFAANWGQIRTYFSVGNGYTLDTNEVGFDRAPFNDIVQDDRQVADDLSIREIGAGLGYRRSFEHLGEAEILGFYYNDRLNDLSVDFLENTLTVRDIVTGDPIAGHGDVEDRRSERFGFGGEYFLSAEHLVGKDARANDGLRLQGQWIRGDDAELRREGWYIQGSYRWSFPTRLLFDRYFRSIEPVVRYGELDTNLTPEPTLSGTWDRQQFVLGAIIEVTGEVFFKVEYLFNHEDTGGERPGVPGPSHVDNDELVVELLLSF